MSRLDIIMGLTFASVYALSGCSKSASDGAGAPTAPSVQAPSNAASVPDQPSSPSAANAGFTRPALEVHSGQYFTYMMPAEWKAAETANGVDMTSPDGKMIANSALLVGSQGTTDPWSFLSQMLASLGVHDLRRVNTEDMPSQPSGYPGIMWQIKEFEVTFTDASGSARQGDCTVGICNAYGGYSALMQSFSTEPADYNQAKTWLPLLAESVKAIDPAKIGYQNNVIPARNHPLDNSALMESWQAKRISQDRIAKAQHETTMGYERMKSETTGKYYNMPFETYDNVRGGYRDPDHLTELLKPTQPGE